MEVKDYYDLHVKREKEGSCIICENDTRYIDLRIGYRDTCGHKCACTMHRRNLKKDKRKFNKFAKKVKINQTKIWKTMDKNEKDRIFGKIALTNKIKIAKLTKKERKVKFGKGLRKFFKTATDERKKQMYDKLVDAKIAKGLYVNRKDVSKFENYSVKCRNLSEANYRKYKKEINPKKLKRGTNGYHLDHIVSVLDGFKNHIAIEIIASRHNLQMLPYAINIKKHAQSWMSIEKLQKLYESSIK